MAIEIERKFLVIGTAWRQTASTRLSQGYLNRDKDRTVRVRIAGEQAFITVKGGTNGLARLEFEYGIPVADAELLLKLSDGPIIEKQRHLFPFAGLTWEIDEFLGANSGLVVAEVELASESQPFEKPQWVGEEVTTDTRYFNSNLATHPFSAW